MELTSVTDGIDQPDVSGVDKHCDEKNSDREPIRVAQIVGKMLGGGVEAVVMNYYRHIDRSKVQFDFLVDEDSTRVPEDEITALGGRIFRIPPYQHPIRYRRELIRLMREQQWPIVHSNINTLSVFGAADVFLETERKDFRMFSLEERERAVELYFTTPMTTAQVVEHLGYPTRQCLERWLAMDSRYAGHMAKPIIPLETRRRAVELVLGGMQQKQAAKQLGVSVGAVHGWVRAYRKGGMAALQPKNRNSAQGNKPAGSRRWPSAADDDDAEALRRRVEELELENALMREVVEVVKKDPGADLRRLSNREKTLLIDRLRPAYSLSSMTCLLAIAPSSYHYHHARLGVDKYAGLRAEVAGAFADSKGRYGYRRIKAVLKTGVSEKVVRRIMAEEGLVAHVPKRRRYSSYEGETTPAPANLVDRDFTAERPNEKWLTDISEIKARDGKVYLSPMIDCFDGKIVAYTAGFSPNAELANRMLEKAASTLPGNARPLVHSDRGCHYRWPGWLGLMERFGLTRSMSAKGCSPDNAAAEGFFGRMKTEAVYPEKWEEHTRNEVLALVDEYIRWYNHERIKQSLGWMSPVQYRQSQGMAA